MGKAEQFAPDDLERCCTGALVHRIFDRTEYVLNGVEVRTLGERTVGYECAKCGRSLFRNHPLTPLAGG